ncbi:MAG: response regulator [Planctomycetota bacterium]|jgi:CheY-like chemotaxis protein
MQKHILIIDDEEAVRRAFTLALDNAGYIVDTAGSGAEGIEMNKHVIYDLIFLDLDMPGVNGVETLRQIRKTDQDVPIYVFNACDRDLFAELEGAWRERLSFEAIHKPADPQLIVTVSELILQLPKEAETAGHVLT